MTWTSKHEKLSIKNNWWKSAERVVKYIVNRVPANRAVEYEFDRQEFEKYLKRFGGSPYHRTTITKVFQHLEEKSDGLIVVLRNYGHGVYKLLVRPISYITENKNPKADLGNGQNRVKPMYTEEQKKRAAQQQQQDITNIDRLCREIGLTYDANALNRIWRLAGKKVDQVVNAIKLLLYRNGTKKVEKPHGFIVDCLKYGWCQDIDLYYQPELPVFKNRMSIDKFVSGIADGILDKKKAPFDVPSPT